MKAGPLGWMLAVLLVVDGIGSSSGPLGGGAGGGVTAQTASSETEAGFCVDEFAECSANPVCSACVVEFSQVQQRFATKHDTHIPTTPKNPVLFSSSYSRVCWGRRGVPTDAAGA